MRSKLFKFYLYSVIFLQLTFVNLYAEEKKSISNQKLIDRLIVKYGDQVYTQKEIEQTFQVANALTKKGIISQSAIAEKTDANWRKRVKLHSFFLTSLSIAKTSTGYRPNKKTVNITSEKLKKQFPNLRALKKLVRQWLWVHQMVEARQRQGQEHFHNSRWFKRAHSKVRTLYYSGAFEQRH